MALPWIHSDCRTHPLWQQDVSVFVVAVPRAGQRLRAQGKVRREGVLDGSGLGLLSGHRGVRVATDCVDDHPRRWDVPNRVACERIPHEVVVGRWGPVPRRGGRDGCQGQLL
jgi:hypothetical protein